MSLKQIRLPFAAWLLAGALLLLLSACSGSANGAEDDNPTTLAPARLDRLILWTADASSPGLHTTDAPGSLGILEPGGTIAPLLSIPERTQTVEACGVNAYAPNRQHATLYIGREDSDGGRLYLLSAGNLENPAVLESNFQLLGCRGGDAPLQFAADSSYLAYLNYSETSRFETYGQGELRVKTTEGQNLLASFMNVVSFDLHAEGIAFTQFFTNENRQADEAVLMWWPFGSDSQDEVLTIQARRRCQFVSSQVLVASSDQLWLVLGERCASGTEWQLYRVDRRAKRGLLAGVKSNTGSMVPYAQVNHLVMSPDQQRLFYTTPDQVTLATAELFMLWQDDLGSPLELIDRSVVVPQDREVLNASPQLSGDGRWLALVTYSPTRESTLHVIDLSDPEAEPYSYPAGASGDTVPYLAFTPDNQRLLFVAGGTNGEANLLGSMNLSSGVVERLARGTYSPWAALAPDASQLALLEWQPLPRGVRGNTPVDLVLINLSNGTRETLLEGGQVVNNGVQNERFASPLLWLP